MDSGARKNLDAQATGARATRRKNERARQASRLVARAEWLGDQLVFWTGSPETIAPLADCPRPLRAVLQDRLADLPAGLYAARLELPNATQATPGRRGRETPPGIGRAPLQLRVTALDEVTPKRVADTARAIEAAAKFPKAAARFVGAVDQWCEATRGQLAEYRRAADGLEARRAGEAAALALQARAFWLGRGAPPSATLPVGALSTCSADSSHANLPAARLAAIGLGHRHELRACHPRLAAWAAAGRALDQWAPRTVARLAEDVGPDTLAALAASTPCLNDATAGAWAEERILDPTPVTADELAGLARLLTALGAVRREPARRHEVMCRLARQHLQLCWTPSDGRRTWEPDEISARFRDLVLDEVYGSARGDAEAVRYSLPDSPNLLAERWIGQEYFGGHVYPYVDDVLSNASIALGNPHQPLYDDPPKNLTDEAPGGSPLDPAGAAAIAAAANRLRWMGAPGACEALATWLDACRPLVPLASFWRDVLLVVSSPEEPTNGDRARQFVNSLTVHGQRLAAELALEQGERADAVRALLPAALARGADATDRILRRDLWLAGEGTLDVALRFVETAERLAGASDRRGPILLPRRVFSCDEAVLRDTLLEFGLAAWAERAAEAATIAFLLDMIQTSAARTGAAPWGTQLPRLHDEGIFVVRRIAARPRAPGSLLEGDTPVLAFFVLDVCARWVDAGFAETRRLARILSDRWLSSEQAAIEWDPDHDDHNRLLVRLSEGRVPRFLALLRLPRASRRLAWRGIDGWTAIETHRAARAWVSACLDRTELAGRVVALLERIGLMTRLDPGFRARRVLAPLDRASGPPPRWPSWVQPEDAVSLTEIHRASAVAGVPGGMPGAVRRVLDRKSTMVREWAALGARTDRRGLSTAERSRASRLDNLFADPAALTADLRRALRNVLPKHRAIAGLAAIEALVAQDLDRRWREVLGGDGVVPDSAVWDNALHMLETVTHNRRVLRRLLKHAARGDRAWIRDLDPNRVFLDRLAAAGIRADAWLAETSRTVQIPGDVFTAYATTDPLEVLQMGSLFGTCLSADRFNAHAAVAAAVEVNKRVLYVKDSGGRVLGRQLLAITRSGEVVGFTCYGAGVEDHRKTGLWVKLALALLSLDIVRASGARVMPGARLAAGLNDDDERSFTLFCKGYVDTPEPFDWWIEALSGEAPGSGEHDRERLRSMLQAPVPAARDRRTAPDWRPEELKWEASRALLWLGADAPSLPAEQRAALGLDIDEDASNKTP